MNNIKILNCPQIVIFLSVLSLNFGIANANVSLPGGDSLLNGAFDEINYGETGLLYISPLLYTSELAVTESPTTTATTTNLTYSYRLSGLGSSLATIEYTIGNQGASAFTGLRFIVNAQTDGSNSFSDLGESFPSPWGVAEEGDPAQFQIVDFNNDDLPSQIQTNNGLDGSDTCGGVCDVDFALQWGIEQINPGELWTISVGLSDDGQFLSSRYLQATSVDSANTALTFSGKVSLVPLPAASILYLFGLGVLGFSKRRKTVGSLVV